MLTTGKLAATRLFERRKRAVRSLRRKYARTPASLHRRARSARSSRTRLLRRGSRRSLLAGLPDGSTYADFAAYMQDRLSDLDRTGTQTFAVGSDREREIRDEMDALFAEVTEGYHDYIMRGQATHAELVEAELLKNKFDRRWMYYQGQIEVGIKITPPGLLEKLKDTVAKMGTGAAIGAAALAAALLFSRK